jgi:hypothetical protein
VANTVAGSMWELLVTSPTAIVGAEGISAFSAAPPSSTGRTSVQAATHLPQTSKSHPLVVCDGGVGHEDWCGSVGVVGKS